MAEETIINGNANERTAEVSFDPNQHDIAKATELARAIGELESENQELARENRVIKERIDKLTTEIAELRDAESKTKRRLVEMEREVDKSDEERKVLEAIAARAADLETEVSRLQHDLINAMNEGDEANAEATKLQKEISEKGVQLEALEKEVEDLRTVKEENEKKVRELETKLRDLEVRELEERNKKVRAEEEMREKIDQKEKEIAGFKKMVEGLESGVGETRAELEKWKSEKMGVEEMLRESEKKVASMEMKMMELKKQVEEAKKVTGCLKDGAAGPFNGSVVGSGHKGLVGAKSRWPVVAAGSAGAVAALCALCVLHTRRK